MIERCHHKRPLMDIAQFTLDEFRTLRADFNDYSRETGERLSRLEAQIYTLVGNGQPGKIKTMEDDIKSIQHWNWRLVGISVGASGVISATLYLFHLLVH